MSKNVLVLATRDGPYSYLAVRALIENNIPLFGVALDQKGVGARSVEIWKERTAEKIKTGNIYDYESKDYPFYTFSSHADKEFEEFIRKNKIDLLVNAGTPNILKDNILQAPSMGVLNVHPSILPEYRGCTTMEWSVYNDDPVGNTAHFMSVGIDEGPIIEQESYVFKKSDTYADIRSKLCLANIEFMTKIVRKIIEQDITEKSLPKQGKGKYWNVMDEKTIEEVKKKLENGLYKYQIHKEDV
ncbi:MAG: formyltransferase family protein [Alphaproteobacteria bacterium]